MGIRRVYVEESRPIPVILVIVSEDQNELGSLVGGDIERLPNSIQNLCNCDYLSPIKNKMV
jgi:tryptophanase